MILLLLRFAFRRRFRSGPRPASVGRALAAGVACAAVVASLGSTWAALGPTDFLKTAGEVIRADSGHGAIVTLRGTNLGGWFMQEPWMSPNGYGAVRRAKWQAQPAAANGVLDGNLHTVWTPGLGHGAATLTIAFAAPTTFDRVALSPGGGTVPRTGWEVALSRNGRTWKPAALHQVEVSHGETVLVLNDAATTTGLRLTHTGEPLTGWSVAELNVYQSDDYTTRMELLDRFGAERADALVRGYQRLWIAPSDLDALQEWGMNVVRAPLDWLDFMTEDGTPKENGWAMVDWLVGECGRRGIYVILDLHAAPGGASPWASSGHAGDDGTGQNPNGLWTNPAFRARTVALWTRLATHFRGNPAVAGYDILNEPLYRFDERPKANEKYSAAVRKKAALLDALYRAVRQADPDHIVFVPAFTASPVAPGEQPSAFDGITPPEVHGWTNVVYQTHHYDMDHARDHDAQERMVTAALADIQRHQAAWHTPMYAGEYCLYDFPDVWAKWMAGLNALHVSWTNWTYKVRGHVDEPGGGNWGFFHDNRSEVPDMVHDSADEIARKWSWFDTGHFLRNTALIDLVRQYTQPPFQQNPPKTNPST